MARRGLPSAHRAGTVLLLAGLSVCVLGDHQGAAATAKCPQLRSASQRSALVRGEPPRPALVAALSRKEQEARAQDLAAAAWVGGLALASEVMQFVNTGLVIFAFQRLTGATSALQLVDALSDLFTRLGWGAYPAYALLLICISVLPLMSALLFIFVAGMLFGPVKGTLLVSTSLSTSAIIACAIAKLAAEKKEFTLETLSPRAATIDAAIGTRPWSTKLLLMTLLRLSPIMPFTFSNYLTGLTSLSPLIVFVGTLLGTLPTQLVYVTAGARIIDTRSPMFTAQTRLAPMSPRGQCLAPMSLRGYTWAHAPARPHPASRTQEGA